MSNLKCPFCQQELEEDIVCSGRVFVSCNNPNCIISDWGGCSKQIITELIRTRKALDVAVDMLKLVYQGNGDPQDIMRYKDNRWTGVRRLCKQALEQITAEQKDVK